MPLPEDGLVSYSDPSPIDVNGDLIDRQLWDDVLLGDVPAMLRAEAGTDDLSSPFKAFTFQLQCASHV